jgi:hypothetical protein
MAKRKSPGKRVTRPEAETKPNSESDKELREREAIGERQKLLDGLTPPPDREALLDELARCFVQAAVTRLLKEQKMKQGGCRVASRNFVTGCLMSDVTGCPGKPVSRHGSALG